MKKIFLIILMGLCCNCADNSKPEIYQTERDEVLAIKDKVKEINIDNVLIGPVARVYLLNDYLIIADCRSDDKLIRIFNKNNFEYICSVGTFGEGPVEIANMGFIGCNNAKNEFYVSDHTKQKIFCYSMDSILTDSLCVPTIKAELNEREFPSRYKYFSDTLSIGLMIKPTGNSGYNQSVAFWNMETGMMVPMKYEHPRIDKKRISMDVSKDYNIYVEGYSNYDLLTICNLKGELVANIYGPDWKEQQNNRISYYRKVAFYKDKIIALYSGKDAFYKDKIKGVSVVLPTQFLVFDIHGSYIKTLDVSYAISDFCCDEENNRLIINFDDDIQFGYIDLEGII